MQSKGAAMFDKICIAEPVSNISNAKLKLDATNRNRKGWYAIIDVNGDRAVGSLHRYEKVERKAFNVKIKDGKFAVDIGTGSGVKVNFRIP